MKYLEFIFQSFWHFIGTLLLCGAIFGGLGQMFSRKTESHYYTKDENEHENKEKQ